METFMGGGVFVAVTKKYVSTTEYSLNTKCEVLWGKITIAGTKPLYEELVSKTSYIHPRHVTHLHYWLPFVIKIVQLSYNMFLLWVTSIWTWWTMSAKWFKVGMSDMQEWTEEVLE